MDFPKNIFNSAEYLLYQGILRKITKTVGDMAPALRVSPIQVFQKICR